MKGTGKEGTRAVKTTTPLRTRAIKSKAVTVRAPKTLGRTGIRII